jgi:putative transcriptional regulator
MGKSAFDKIAEGLNDAIAFAQGDTARARIASSIDVKAIRNKTRLSQTAFAGRLHISAATVRNWEQGIRCPDAPSRTLLAMIDADPETAMQLLGKVSV